MSSDVVFVVYNSTQYLNWDDRGALATGYPHWTTLINARQYQTYQAAERAAESVVAYEKTTKLWIQTVHLEPREVERYVPIEQDPEWEEYERLSKKFKGKVVS